MSICNSYQYSSGNERIASRIGNGGLADIAQTVVNMEDMLEDVWVGELPLIWDEVDMNEYCVNKQEDLRNHLTDVMMCAWTNPAVETDHLSALHDYWRYVQGDDETASEPDCYWYHPDHLGSSSWITYTDGEAVQHLHYLPWGEEFVDQRITDFSARHTFSAKEKDSETGLSYFGSRYYSNDLSIWLSVDPMSDKYPSLSPYVYCADNLVKLVDPNGEEGIVVSGGEYNGNRYKYNFIEPAINRLKELKSAGGDESITWAVMTAGYSEEDIAKFQSIANDLGVQFQAIGSAEEFTNYLNSKDINSPFLSDARTGDKITSLTVFGHGFVGSVEFAYNQDNQSSFSWGMESIVKLHRGAFENAIIDLYSCNSATDVEGGKSLAYTLAIMTGSTVTGFKGQSTYSEMNKGQGFMAKWNRWLNGFNSNGSVTLPKAGTGARKKIFVHK